MSTAEIMFRTMMFCGFITLMFSGHPFISLLLLTLTFSGILSIHIEEERVQIVIGKDLEEDEEEEEYEDYYDRL